MKIVTDELEEKELEYISGFISMQLMFMIDLIDTSESEKFAADFLRALRPELATYLVKRKDNLFSMQYRRFIKITEVKGG